MEEVKRILVVSRDTQYCKKAVHYGMSLARCYGAELFVIHVVHNPFSIQGWNLPIPSLAEEYQQILRETKEELTEIIREERARGVQVTQLIREGEPTKEILQTIRDKHVDLLIMLAHEEGRLEHFLFGRSNDEIFRAMPCSIFMVKRETEPVNF